MDYCCKLSHKIYDRICAMFMWKCNVIIIINTQLFLAFSLPLVYVCPPFHYSHILFFFLDVCVLGKIIVRWVCLCVCAYRCVGVQTCEQFYTFSETHTCNYLQTLLKIPSVKLSLVETHGK